MMNGYGMYMMMGWMPLVMLFWLIVTVVVIWLVIRWLNQKKSTTIPPYTPPQGFSQPYERGYHHHRQYRKRIKKAASLLRSQNMSSHKRSTRNSKRCRQQDDTQRHLTLARLL